MDSATLNALLGSIEKWEGIAFGDCVDKGPRNCPLCFLFYEGGCSGCPVMESGHYECGGTPCDDFTELAYGMELRGYRGPNGVSVAALPREFQMEAADIARAEWEFLIGLLPDDWSGD